MQNQKGFTSTELAIVITFGFIGGFMGFALYVLVHFITKFW
jgi:hypothetical protein